MNFAVDFGNANTKGMDDKGHKVSFESGYTMKYDDDAILFRGEYYTFNRHMEPEEDKTVSDRMMICTLHAIAKILEERGADSSRLQEVNLAVDIPINKFNASEKQKYINYYLGKTEVVEFHGKTWRVRFTSVMAFPQGVSVYVANRGKYADKDSLNIIDIGGGTTDVATVVINPDRTIRNTNKFGVDIGTLNLTRAIADELSCKNITLTNAQIENAIARMAIDNKRSMEIMNVIHKNIGSFIPDLINNMRNRGVNIDNPTILMSGGAAMLADYIDKAVYITDKYDQYGNCEAILKCLMASTRG